MAVSRGRHCVGSSAVLTVLAALSMGKISQGAVATWIGGASPNKWATGSNWSTGAQPGGSSTALFNTAPANLTVSMSNTNGISAGPITFDTGAGNFNFSTTGPLNLTAGLKTVTQGTGVNRVESFNIPVVLLGGYTFENDVANTGSTLVYGSTVTTTASNTSTLTLAGSGTGTNSIAGVISDTTTGTLGKIAITSTATAGAWKLSAPNTYTGNTTITSGNIILAGGAGTNVLAGTAVTVGNAAAAGAAAKLSVTGTVTIGTTSAGTLTLVGGDSATSTGGTLDMADGALGSLTLRNATNGATVRTLGGAAGKKAAMNFDVTSGGVDQLLMAGLINIGDGGGIISLNAVGIPALNTPYTLISTGGLAAGSFDFTHLTFADGGYSAVIGGNTYTLSSNATSEFLTVSVPEPAACATALIATSGLLRRRRSA